MFNVQLKKKIKSHYKQFEILLFLATRTTPPFRLLFNWIDALVFLVFSGSVHVVYPLSITIRSICTYCLSVKGSMPSGV